jgi:hypothetical protein
VLSIWPLPIKIWINTSQNVLVWLNNMILAQYFCTVLPRLVVKRHNLAACCAPLREECNKYDLTGALCLWLAWPANHKWMIGPGGLLLVVSHLFAVSLTFLVLWVELPRGKITKLGCEKYFLQSHILYSLSEHH